MKYLGSIADNKDLVTKEYVDQVKSNLEATQIEAGIIPFWCDNKYVEATTVAPSIRSQANLYTINGDRTLEDSLRVDFYDLHKWANTLATRPYIELKANSTYLVVYEPIVANNIAGEGVRLYDVSGRNMIAMVDEGQSVVVRVSTDITASFYFVIPSLSSYDNYQFRVWLFDLTSYNVQSSMIKEDENIYQTLGVAEGLVNYWGSTPMSSLKVAEIDIQQRRNILKMNGTASYGTYYALSESTVKDSTNPNNFSKTIPIIKGRTYKIISKVYSEGEQFVNIRLRDNFATLIGIQTNETGTYVAKHDDIAVLYIGIPDGTVLNEFQFEVDLIEYSPTNFWEGKKVVWYGDSLSYGSTLSDTHDAYSYLTADALGMQINNYAVGGSVFAKQTKAEAEEAGAGYYDEIVFSLEEWNTMEKDISKSYLVLDDPTQSHPYRIYSYSNGTWNPTASYTSKANGRYPIVDVVKRTSEDSDADLIVLAIGYNDFMYHWTPFGTMDDRGKNTFYGALHEICLYLLENFPTKQFVFVSLIASRYQRNGTLNADWTCDSPDDENPLGKTIGDYTNAVEQVCQYYGIPFLNLGKNIGFAQFQHPTTYCASDNLHWNVEGHRRAASVLIPMIKNLRNK